VIFSPDGPPASKLPFAVGREKTFVAVGSVQLGGPVRPFSGKCLRASPGCTMEIGRETDFFIYEFKFVVDKLDKLDRRCKSRDFLRPA
jgi:hypothetical protein